MSTALGPQGKAMYVATNSDKEWLLSVQRKLYTRSWETPPNLRGNIYGEPGADRKMHAGFGGGDPGDRWVKALYGVGGPIPIFYRRPTAEISSETTSPFQLLARIMKIGHSNALPLSGDHHRL